MSLLISVTHVVLKGNHAKKYRSSTLSETRNLVEMELKPAYDIAEKERKRESPNQNRSRPYQIEVTVTAAVKSKQHVQ